MHIEIEKLANKLSQKGKFITTDKEKIIKKAGELGVDEFEVEMYLENYEIEEINNPKETKKCSYCNANIPFISNVCSFCGKELTLSNEISDEELIANINKNIKTIEKIRIPSVFELLLKYGTIFFGVLSIVTILITVVFFPGTISLRVVLYVILGIGSYFYYKNMKSATPNFNQEIDKTVFTFEKNQNLFKLYYSNNSEIQNITEKFNNKVNKIRTNIKSAIKSTVAIYITLFIVLIGLLLVSTMKNGYSYLEKNDTNIIKFTSENIFITGNFNNLIEVVGNDFEIVIIKDEYSSSKKKKYYAEIEINLNSNKLDSTKLGDLEKLELNFVNGNEKSIKNMPTFSFSEIDFMDTSTTFYYLFENINSANQFIKTLENKDVNLLISTF